MILCYARVSTDQQAADGTTSLAEQERRMRGLAQMRGADKYDVQVFVDAGISGALPLAERPAGKEMLEAAKPGDIICASKLDRLFRSASDALNTVELLKERKISVILLDIASEPVNENGVAKLFFSILAAVAEFERERIAERITDGRRCKADRGGHVGGIAPYGFRIEGDGRQSRLVEVPEEQKILTFVKARSGWSPAGIERALTQAGFRSRSGRPFQINQVQRILRQVVSG